MGGCSDGEVADVREGNGSGSGKRRVIGSSVLNHESKSIFNVTDQKVLGLLDRQSVILLNPHSIPKAR